MRISDWSADVCSSDLADRAPDRRGHRHHDQEGGRLVTRDILTIADLDSGGLNAILDLSTRADPGRPLAGTGVALVFQTPNRPEQRRAGQRCAITCRSRVAPYHYKHNNKNKQQP